MGAEAVDDLEENEEIPFKCFSCDGGLGYFKSFLSKTADWMRQLEDFRVRLEKFNEKEKEKEREKDSGFKICGFRDAVLTPVLEKVVFEKGKVETLGNTVKTVETVENTVETVKTLETAESTVETVGSTVKTVETEKEEPPAKKQNLEQQTVPEKNEPEKLINIPEINDLP